MQIDIISDLRAALRAGPYAWPGGYPKFFLMADGEALSFDALKDRFTRREVLASLAHSHRSDQWRVVACEINWEDTGLTCCQTGKPIQSAYGED